MNDLLTTILQNITTKPDAAKVSMQMEGDVELYTIEVDPEDVGRVIGKSGKVIRAIRSLAHVAAVHTQKKVRVHLEDGNPVMPAPAQTAAPASPAPVSQPVIAGEVDLSPVKPTVAPVPPAPAMPDTADLLPEETV